MAETPADLLSATNIGLRIKALRLALGYPRSGEFAETYGVTIQAHSNYERGQNPPTVWPMIALCERYPGVTLEFIFRGIPDAMPYKMTQATIAELKKLVGDDNLPIA